MRKFPTLPREKSNYLSFIILPNAVMCIALFLMFNYHFNENFCKFKSGVFDTKFLYYLMLVICSYNLGKIILTIVEFEIHTFPSKGEYWYKDKFNIVCAISEKQFKRMVILASLTVICFFGMIGWRGNVWQENITEEYRTNLRNKRQAEEELETSSDEKNISADLLDMNLQIKLEVREDDDCHNYLIMTRPNVPFYDNNNTFFDKENQIGFLVKKGEKTIGWRNATYTTEGTFYHKGWENKIGCGDYEITLVLGYDSENGDYIPISNTIYFTFNENTINEDVEWYDSKINYKSVPLDKEAAKKKADEIAAKTEK